MALGDLYKKSAGVWSPRKGSIRGAGPAQLTPAWLPTFPIETPAFNDHTIGMWDWRGSDPWGASLIGHYYDDDGIPQTLYPTFREHSGTVTKHCYGPTKYPGDAQAYLIRGTSETYGRICLTTAYWSQISPGVWAMASDPLEPVSDKFTISMWVRLVNPAQYANGVGQGWLIRHKHVDFYGAVNDIAVGLGWVDNAFFAAVSLRGEVDQTGPYRATFDFGRIPFYDWFLISASHDGSDLRLYINGVEVSSIACSGDVSFRHKHNHTSAPYTWADPWTLGGSHDILGAPSGSVLDGYIGTLWIEDGAQDPAWLRHLYELGAKRY